MYKITYKQVGFILSDVERRGVKTKAFYYNTLC